MAHLFPELLLRLAWPLLSDGEIGSLAHIPQFYYLEASETVERTNKSGENYFADSNFFK